jgi:FkbM family methyltransferase
MVKVGANDGLTGDPFADLLTEDERWCALLIEPVPYCVERLKKSFSDSSRFVIEEVAIGATNGKKEFFYVDLRAKVDMPDLPGHFDQIGSFSRGHITKHFSGRLEPYILSKSVECRTLSQVLDDYEVSQPALLLIDTEGADLEVMMSLDFRRHRPYLVFVEHKHLSRRDRSRLFQVLRQAGYVPRRCGGDCLAVRRDFLKLWAAQSA